MNRLTRKSQNSEMVWFIDHDNNGLNLEPCEMSYSDSGKAIRKLADYEETGLTPQEIEQMKARMPLHQWAGESPDKMSIFSVPVSKIMELTKAEKQERILMLPCKIVKSLNSLFNFPIEVVLTPLLSITIPSMIFEEDIFVFSKISLSFSSKKGILTKWQ